MSTLWSGRRRCGEGLADDRGDVPGWVLITLMTAALVVMLWVIAGPAITQIFQDALESVSVIG